MDPDDVPGPPEQLFDVGLQPERTALAWRRTVLTLVVVAALVLRALAHALPLAWTAVPVAAVVVGCLAAAGSHRRYRRTYHWLRDRGHPPGLGETSALLATAASGLGLLAAAAVLVALR